MLDVVLASARRAVREKLSRALSAHHLILEAVDSGAALADLATGPGFPETKVAVIDLDLPKLTDRVIRLVHAETPIATGFIYLWDDAEDVQRIRNLTLRQCRFIRKAFHGPRNDETRGFLDELTQGILDFASWKHGSRIRDVIFAAGRDTFLIVFRSGRTYKLPKRLIPNLDKTDIKRVRVRDDGSAFVVEQDSGNSSEIPWDFVLYHLEPDYEHYKGRDEGKRLERLTAQRIGRRLKELRAGLGLTASEVAARSGIRRPNISRIERGKHAPSLETLERIADALGIPVAALVA